MKQIDRIRNMNAEEMARMLHRNNGMACNHCKGYNYCMFFSSHEDCEKSIKAWLESEVEEDDRA